MRAPRIFLLVICSLAAVGRAAAQDERDLIRQGNTHYEAGRFAEALEAYDQAAEQAGVLHSADLLHNRAAAQFKLGRIDEARELWVRAASLKDAAFESAVRYNLGNCDYADALQAAEARDAQAALDLLDRATKQYRDAIRLEPERANARANLELAQQLKKQIEEQTTTQPQSQPSPDQQGDEQQNQDQNATQPSSQPSSQPSEQSDQSDQQPASQPQSQPADEPEPEPESQPAPQSQPESQPAAGQPDQSQPPVPLNMTRDQAERLLQMVRDLEKARREMLLRREAARYQAEKVARDW